MSATGRLLLRSIVALAIPVACAASSAAVVHHLLPPHDAPAIGLRIEGESLPPGSDLSQYLADRASRIESRQIQVVFADDVPPRLLSLRELGLRVDLDTLRRRALAVGRTGSVEQRIDEAIRARRGLIDIPVTWTIDPEPLLSMVEARKDDLDRPGSPARFDFGRNTVLPHTNGRYLDAYESLRALDAAVRQGSSSLRLAWTDIPPVVSEQMLRRLDMSQVVGHYETRFGYLGGQADRAHNIATAASRLDGVVVLPSQIVSFNQIVGHRTLANGFRKGWEIFKGEMVQGVGGGTCQVASTLHAAAFLAGFDIIERAPHSRPSAYIPLGLDATVVDGLVDLKLRNPFPFPVVLHSIVQDGSLTFELRGEQRPARVAFRGDVVGVQRYRRKITEAAWLPDAKVVRKQRGIPGYRVRKTRTIVMRDGSQREEVTTDVYPPTLEILLVPEGMDPSVLPPLPSDDTSTSPAPPACSAACPPPPVIEDSPEARHSSAPAVPRETVIQR